MSEFNFNSQVATSREQSERLLALGLKKETADMCLSKVDVFCQTFDLMSPHNWTEEQSVSDTWYPAWSLHRLIEMCDVVIRVFKKRISLSSGEGFNAEETLYDNLINCIEWLIEEGYFNKEYLEE